MPTPATCVLHNGHQALKRITIGQDIVHQQHLVPAAQQLLADDDPILKTLGIGFHLCHIDLAVEIDGAGLFRVHHRNAQSSSHGAGDGDAGHLNGQHLGDTRSLEAAGQLLADPVDQLHIQLMVQKGIHLQHIAGFDYTVF